MKLWLRRLLMAHIKAKYNSLCHQFILAPLMFSLIQWLANTMPKDMYRAVFKELIFQSSLI